MFALLLEGKLSFKLGPPEAEPRDAGARELWREGVKQDRAEGGGPKDMVPAVA